MPNILSKQDKNKKKNANDEITVVKVVQYSYSEQNTDVDLISHRINNSNNESNSLSLNVSKNRHIEHIKDKNATGAKTRVMVERLKQCCVIFDFNDRTSDLQYKEVKSKTLKDLANQFYNYKLTEEIYPLLIEMFSLNVFRPMPPSTIRPCSIDYNPEVVEPSYEAAWPHIELVYILFTKAINSKYIEDGKLQKYVNQRFITQLLELFNSQDPRERGYVKSILHTIYGKIIGARAFIRKEINAIFFTFIYETEKFNGINELLEVLGSIINGFVLPLKEEHIKFLKHILVPLHKVNSVSVYHPTLAYCTQQLIDKDVRLGEPVVKGILRFWPKFSTNKELLFLNELEDIIEILDIIEFNKLCDPIFRQIAKCVCSQHAQVAERALYYWNNNNTVSKISCYVDIIFPIMFPALFRAKVHWNRDIHPLVFNALRVFMDIDPDMFDKKTQSYKKERQMEKEKIRQREKNWQKLEDLVSNSTVPFCSNISSTMTLASARDKALQNGSENEGASSSNSADSLYQKQDDLLEDHLSRIRIANGDDDTKYRGDIVEFDSFLDNNFDDAMDELCIEKPPTVGTKPLKLRVTNIPEQSKKTSNTEDLMTKQTPNKFSKTLKPNGDAQIDQIDKQSPGSLMNLGKGPYQQNNQSALSSSSDQNKANNKSL